MGNHPLILFDGICVLCNKTVNFLLQHDSKKQFRYVALQSDVGIKLTENFEVPPATDSVLLIYENLLYTESEAALKIASLLPFPWKTAVIFKIIPKNIRNKIYRWIAKNRYRWFGKNNSCRIPVPEEKIFFPEMEDLEF
jgi:predicted DCC family thiol-disulfide oxidoreductase YuxK